MKTQQKKYLIQKLSERLMSRHRKNQLKKNLRLKIQKLYYLMMQMLLIPRCFMEQEQRLLSLISHGMEM